MPNPCPPYDDQNSFGPYRVGFTVALPGGWSDSFVTDPVTGQNVSTVLNDLLKNAFNNLAAPITPNLRGSWLETVQCGSAPKVAFAPLLDAAGTATWYVEVNQFAPNGLSPWPLDHPWVARMWMDTLDVVALPAGAGNATLTPGSVAYRVDGKFAAIVPDNYAAVLPGTLQPGDPWPALTAGAVKTRYEDIAATGQGANAGFTSAATTTYTIASVIIADPGYPYRLKGSASMRLNSVSHTDGYASHSAALMVDTQVIQDVSAVRGPDCINSQFLGIQGPAGAGDLGFVRLAPRRSPTVYTGQHTVYFLFKNGSFGTCNWGPLNTRTDYYMWVDVEPA